MDDEQSKTAAPAPKVPAPVEPKAPVKAQGFPLEQIATAVSRAVHGALTGLPTARINNAAAAADAAVRAELKKHEGPAT